MTSKSPDKAYPFAREDADIARNSWIQANMTPKAAILAGKLVILLQTVLLVILSVALVKVVLDRGRMHVQIVRINDVGRAEVVRLDTDYIPNEPELRDQMERFVIRYYTRNGFQIPEAIDALPIYLDSGIFEAWRKEVLEALTQIANGAGNKRVRILSCRIQNPALAKTVGTVSTVRIAVDDQTSSGALVGGSSEGWELTIRFKIGVYPDFSKDDRAKDQWLVRNPLGIKVMEIQRTRYIGADVEDQKAERVVELVQKQAEEQLHRDKALEPKR